MSLGEENVRDLDMLGHEFDVNDITNTTRNKVTCCERLSKVSFCHSLSLCFVVRKWVKAAINRSFVPG